jgi:hypothetical protein
MSLLISLNVLSFSLLRLLLLLVPLPFEELSVEAGELLLTLVNLFEPMVG